MTLQRIGRKVVRSGKHRARVRVTPASSCSALTVCYRGEAGQQIGTGHRSGGLYLLDHLRLPSSSLNQQAGTGWRNPCQCQGEKSHDEDPVPTLTEATRSMGSGSSKSFFPGHGKGLSRGRLVLF